MLNLFNRRFIFQNNEERQSFRTDTKVIDGVLRKKGEEESMNDNYSIIYEIENKYEGSGASDSGSNPDRSVILQKQQEKLEEYYNLLLLEQKTGKWNRRVKCWLGDFISSCNVYDVSEVTNYLKNLQERYSTVSYRKQFYQIRRFLRESIEVNYLDKIRLPRVVSNPVKIVTSEDINKTIEYFYKDKKHFLRFRAIIMLLSSSGLRPSELFQLKREDIDLENRIVYVRVDKEHHTKTGNSRITFFTERTKQVLQLYLKSNKNRVLFNESTTERAFLNSPLKVKEFRKFFSQEATRKNMNQAVKERLLGHSLNGVDNLHYLSLSDEDLKRVYDQTFK